MSGILFRYVLRSFAVPAAICLVGLCALTLLFMSFDLIGAFFDPKACVTGRVAFDFLAGTLSMYLEWLLPAVFLLSTLYTMWQFCRHSELVAMRAGGIGMGTIVAPILLAAFAAAGLSFANTELYKPAAAARAMAIKNSDFRATGREPMPGGFFAPRGDHSWVIGELSPEDPGTLRDVRVTFFRPDGSQRVAYAAPLARWLDGAWWLLGGVRRTRYNELNDQEGAPETFPSLALYGAPETPQQILVQNLSDLSLASADDREANREIREQSGMSTRQKNEDSYVTYNHYAAPFSIVLVTLFAIPAGIASGRQSVFRGILLALGLFLSYYVLTAVAMSLSNADVIKPALAVSLPCIVFGAAALALFRKLP